MAVALITVGTSLFYSASWKRDASTNAISGYSQWLTPEKLRSPSSRRVMNSPNGVNGSDIEDTLIRTLTVINATRWAQSFETSCLTDPMRYSAEMATLLREWVRRAAGQGFAEFLNDKYTEIKFLCRNDDRDPAHVAAAHLAAYLSHLGVRNCCLQEILKGNHISQDVRDYLDYLGVQDEQDVVHLYVSGGYKILAMTAGFILPRRINWDAIYLHENQQLCRQNARNIAIDDQSFDLL